MICGPGSIEQAHKADEFVALPELVKCEDFLRKVIAKAVRDEMVRQGMDGSGIAVDGKSFHDPLVPTGPDVKEPQNRRAVIDLGG